MRIGLASLLVAAVAMAWSGSFARAESVRAEVECPHERLESCRWDIHAHSSEKHGERTVRVEWDKSLVSRHREKPMAKPIRCNVDRDFDVPARGYIHVWFRGESAPCNPMARKPADCGVTFLLDAPGELTSSYGFTVTAPAGKVLEKVEHFSTLNLQCGDFKQADLARLKWKARIGWRADLPGEGTYSANTPPVAE